MASCWVFVEFGHEHIIFPKYESWVVLAGCLKVLLFGLDIYWHKITMRSESQESLDVAS